MYAIMSLNSGEIQWYLIRTVGKELREQSINRRPLVAALKAIRVLPCCLLRYG